MQIKVVERSQQIQVQEQEIVRRERELDAIVRKPAEAEKYKLEKLAEANKYVGITLLTKDLVLLRFRSKLEPVQIRERLKNN